MLYLVRVQTIKTLFFGSNMSYLRKTLTPNYILVTTISILSKRNKITVSSEKLVFAERKINVAEGVSLADCLNHW